MTKDRILEVATKEFSKYGYDAVSMNSLSKLLDINKATIYYHFRDKKALYQEVISNILEMTLGGIERVLEKKVNPREKFKIYIKARLETTRKCPHIVPLYLRETANFGSKIDENILMFFEKDLTILKKIVFALDLKDKYKKTDPYVILSLIVGTVLNYYSFQMSHLEFKDAKDFNKDADSILDYLTEFISNILLDALCQN